MILLPTLLSIVFLSGTKSFTLPSRPWRSPIQRFDSRRITQDGIQRPFRIRVILATLSDDRDSTIHGDASDSSAVVSTAKKLLQGASATIHSQSKASSPYDPADAFFLDDSPADELLDPLFVHFDEDEVQPSDIICDLDGSPLTAEYFRQAMGLDQVDYYTCPEKDAFRGFMSKACRVYLHPGGQTAFYKRIIFEHLEHAKTKLQSAPFKLVRDMKSYQVVASFLASEACQSLMDTTGVMIPKCYHFQLEPNHENPMKAKFSFLLEDFAPSDGWYQQWILATPEECKVALSTFAKIHAFFWNGSNFWKDQPEAAQALEQGIWTSGSYVQPCAQNADQHLLVAEEWAKKRLRFEKELSSFDFWDTLGRRLQSVSEESGRLAHPFGTRDSALAQSYEQYRTFTHGDPKQANLLFRRREGSEDKLDVGLIDFQWSGFGLAATDIAHLITSAIHADLLVDGGEQKLRRFYYDELQRYLVEYGAYDTAREAKKSFSYETFVGQYETAVLDLVRLVVAYTWSRFEEPVTGEDKEACARTMNKTSYNKSIPNVIWLMAKCDEILKSRGV